MADSGNLVLKISFGDQLRRIQLTALKIAEVREQVARLFPTVKFYTLSYLDEEQDKITVSTDLELEEAYRIFQPTIRLTLEQLDRQTPSCFVACPAGSLIDDVSLPLPLEESSPVQEDPVAPSPAAPPSAPPAAASACPFSFSSLPSPVGSIVKFLSPKDEYDDVESQKELEMIIAQEKEEKEEEERIRAERDEKERREREEREEKERREREEKERREREEKERLQREEQERLAIEQQRNKREEARAQILQSNAACGEILEKLLSDGVELELAWQALEFSNYSNEARARNLLKMNELGFDFQQCSDALNKYPDVNEAINSFYA